MKLSIVLLLAGLSLAAASPQGFGGFVRNLLGGGRNRPQNNGNRGNRGNRGNGGGGRCGGGNRPNHSFNGRDYLVSWRLGCTSFTQSQAASFCRANGMRPISIDSSAKEREFLGLVGRERQKYFWTGGNVRGRNIRWPK